MRILVTGASGFVGQHLLSILHRANHEVIPQYYKISYEQSENLRSAQLNDGISFDIRDRDKVFAAIKLLKPDGIIHLAAQSSVKLSWVNPNATFESNLIGTCNILDAVKEYAPECRVITTGSAEEYAEVLSGERVSENSRCDPKNPYALSKYAVSNLVRQYVDAYRMRIVHVRPFNQIGPGQSRIFVVSDFAYQLVEIQMGNKPPILNVGNLSAIRDFTDVRDVAIAYRLLIENQENDLIYNIASGYGISIRNLVERMINLLNVEIEISVDPLRFRPVEIERLIGDSSKIQEALGWRTTYSLDDTLKDVLIEQGAKFDINNLQKGKN